MGRENCVYIPTDMYYNGSKSIASKLNSTLYSWIAPSKLNSLGGQPFILKKKAILQ